MSAIRRPCICLVTDRAALSPEAETPAAALAALERFLEEAVDAGVDLIQIRERDLEAARLRDLTAAVVAHARSTSTAIVVNDRADVAMASGAAGVHLRSDGPPVAAVRRLMGRDRIVGRSIHAADEARRYESADYLIFGTVFESVSKPGQAAAGLDALARAVTGRDVPVLAIGGITADRARACAEAGAAGVAAISLFLPPGRTRGSLGVAAATARLRAALAGRVLE